ncbi:unnamed protein product [Urochloa decumbens]|uniref:RING-type domain-containing protein n=1 Tax=Urochloa decumbens TaxID=240449 RepID=A0ABC8WU94_9POAL
MATTVVPPPPPPALPERRVPVVPRLADDGGGRGDARGSSSAGGGGVAGISPSILIIAVIVVVMLLASLCIHYFIRHLCRHVGPAGSSSSSSRQAPPPPLPLVARHAAGASVAPADQGAAGGVGGGKAAEAETERLIARLPLFTLSSSLAVVPKSSRDCAVCQSAFRDDDELRLLPACRHAFHSRCVDPWLRGGNPSCPLCRASIALPHPPLTDLLRVELGSVSSRRSNPDAAAAAVRAYPLPAGGLPNSASSEYLVEEELQVVLKPTPQPPQEPPPPAAPAAQQIEVVERGQASSSAGVGLTPTGSFRSTAERRSSRWSNRWSSRWSSGRWSSRYDAGTVTAAATAEWWWDMDGGAAPTAERRRREAEDGGTASFYGFVRWLTGAY